MNAIRIVRTIDSETLHLPELRPFIGKRVEILVLDEAHAPVSTEDRWKPLRDIAGKDLIDPAAYREGREYSRLHPTPIPELPDA